MAQASAIDGLQAAEQRLRRLLDRLAQALDELAAPDELRGQFTQTREALGQPLHVVLTGEFNSGKSALINALYGRRVVTEGVVPTTSLVTILRYAGEPAT